MELSTPIWISSYKCYKINVNDCSSLCILKDKSVFLEKIETPDIKSNSLAVKLAKICEVFIQYYKKWFPANKNIDNAILLKQLTHRWNLPSPPPDLEEGFIYFQFWKPTAILFGVDKFEVCWLLFETTEFQDPGSKVNEEMMELETEILPSYSSDKATVNIEIRGKTELKKRIRQARLKAAFAEMKAAKLAEEYYNKYANDSDSSVISDDSEKESEEESEKGSEEESKDESEDGSEDGSDKEYED